jgi:iron complex outermembrane receptor protein
LGVDIGERQRLEFSVNRFDDRQETDFTTDPIVDQLPGRQKARALEGLELDEPQESENTVLNLSYRHGDLLGSQVDAQVYYRDYFTRFLPFDGRRFPSLANSVIQSWVESEKWGGRLGIETPLSSGGTVNLLWGLDYVNEDTAQPVSIIDPIAFEASGGLVFREIGDRTWTPPVELSSLGIFAQLNWEISDRFTLNGGLRHERAGIEVDDFTTITGDDVIGGELDFDATLFNIGAVFDATDEISLFANFSQGFSLADVGRVLRNVPDGVSVEAIEPEPQQVDNYEIGVRGSWRNLQASLSGFYNESDLGTTFAADFSTVRAPERIYGLEATLDTQPGDNWRLGGTFSWVEGEVDTDDDGDFDPLDGFRIPPVKITAYIENETLPGWRNRIQALFSGSRDRFEDSTAFGRREVESYFVVDFITSINVGRGRLELGVENLFDNQYFPIVSQLQSSDSLYAAARGRTLSLRYSINW